MSSAVGTWAMNHSELCPNCEVHNNFAANRLRGSEGRGGWSRVEVDERTPAPPPPRCGDTWVCQVVIAMNT